LTRKHLTFVGLAFVAAAALWFLGLRRASRVAEPGATPREQAEADAARAPGPTAPRAAVVLASNVVPSVHIEPPPLAPEPPHPHPITPQHERIYRENQLTFSLDGAVDVEDVAGIRRLLAIYRQEFPEDSLVLQQGYEIIANCLERPGATTRDAAQQFYDIELASALRRHVRRHCLEKP